MPLWLSSLRQRTCRSPLRSPFRSSFLHRLWQSNLHLARSYSTALRESPHDDTGLNGFVRTRDALAAANVFPECRSLDSGDSCPRGASHGSSKRGRRRVERLKVEHTPVAKTKKKETWRRRLFSTRPPGVHYRAVFRERRRKVIWRFSDQPKSLRKGRKRHAASPANLATRTRSALDSSREVGYLSTWKKQIRKIEINRAHRSEWEWFRSRWIPILDTRASEWTERILKRLDEGQKTLGREERFFDSEVPSYVWIQTALWLLTYKPRLMTNFLLATHVEPLQSQFYIEDSLSFLAEYWFWSQEPDRVFELRRLADAVCVLANRGGEEKLTFFSPFFRTLIRYCSGQQIQDLYQTTKQHQVSVHWNTYLHFTTYFAKNSQFEQALNALADARDAGADLDSYAFRSNCATVLRRSSQQPDGLRVCLRIVSYLVDIGVELNNPICDIIMLNAVEAGDLKTAFAVYHSLVERGLQPTESTFAILLKGCKMNIDDAETLHETIRNAIENVAVRKSEVASTEILHCLALHHSKHNPKTAVHTLTEAYAQLFDLRPLLKLGLPLPAISQHHDDFMLPTQYALNSMIATSIEQHLQHLPYTTGVLPLYERWRGQVEVGEPCLANLATSDHTANIFLKAFIQRSSGLIHAARVVRDMQRPLPPLVGVEQVKPTVQSWSIFLHGFTRHGKMKLAEQILNYMRSKGIEPNNVTWNTLLTGYARRQDEEGVIDAVRRAEQGGLVWDGWTHGGLQWLKYQPRLQAELEKDRLQRRLDFTDELRQGLAERLSMQGDSEGTFAVEQESASEHYREEEKRDGFADSPGEIAEQSHHHYRRF